MMTILTASRDRLASGQALWCRLCVVSLFVLGVGRLFGQEEFDENTLRLLVASRVAQPQSNVDLPASVPAPPGRLTLYADYAVQDKRGIPLYLVNRTDSPVEFPSQDRTLYVFLQRADAEGKWERAQPSTSSWCGNSYFSVTLLPGQHFAFFGYQPVKGEKAKIRFAFSDRDLSTEVGEGLVSAEVVELARRDGMARSAPSVLESLVDEEENPRRSVTPQQRVAALRLLWAYGGSPYYKDVAEKIAANWEAKQAPSSDEIKGAKAIRELLLQPWPSEPSADALSARCLEALQAGRGGGIGFGMPEGDPDLVWKVLAELAKRDRKNDAQKWRPVVDFAQKNPSPANLTGLMAVASVPWIAEELLPDAFFERGLIDGDSKIQRIAAGTLSRRMQWNHLAEIGKKLSPEAQLIVLGALAYPESGDPEGRVFPRNAREEIESSFWEHCMATQPLKAAYTLRLGHSSEYNSFNRVVHDPLREFLREEAMTGASVAEDFDLGRDASFWRIAVEFLGSWKMDEDIEVFRKLLEYRGYEKNEGWAGNDMKPFVRHRYGVREAAKNALLRKGVSVPEDLVLEKDVTK